MNNTLKRVVVAVMAIGGLLAVPQVALAQDAPAPLVTEGASHQLIISNPVWTILVGLALPLVVGLITKASASKPFQAIVGIVTAALGALVVRATQVYGSALIDQALIVDIALVYLPQIATYVGVWKNLDLNNKAVMLPSRGLG